MPQNDSSGALANRARDSRDHDPGPEQERHQAAQWALANATQLAHSQLEVLARLDKADQAGDDESVLRCHAELDHVMALVAEADRVRVGVRTAPTGESDLICAGCGSAAEPVYETPHLLGYRCTRCDWAGDDPAARAQRLRAEAQEASAELVGQAARAIANALVILEHRGKKAREEGTAVLRVLREDLAAADSRFRRAQLSSA